MGPLFHVLRAPVLGRLGSFACRGRRGSRLVGCVRRFRPPPPPLVGFWSVVRPLFCSLAFPGFARSGLGVSCWCSLLFSSPFFCVPRPGSLLGSCHLIVIFISRSFSFHLPCCGRVCVCSICIDVKLLYSGGPLGNIAVSGQRRRCNVPV